MDAFGYIQVPAVGPGTSWLDVARAGTPTRIWGLDPDLPYAYAGYGIVPDRLTQESAQRHELIGAGLLAVAIIVGGTVLVKAAVDHVMDVRAERAVDAEEFEEQHYRAAGFTREEPASLGTDLVALAAAVAGTAWLLSQARELLQ